MNNRLHNCTNPHQGETKKVLCVCSAGLLRSPTAARILSQPPFNYNTRAVGLDQGHALIPMDEVLYEWADIIVVMDDSMARRIKQDFGTRKVIVDLKIPGSYAYMDEQLVEMIKSRWVFEQKEDPMAEMDQLLKIHKNKEKGFVHLRIGGGDGPPIKVSENDFNVLKEKGILFEVYPDATGEEFNT